MGGRGMNWSRSGEGQLTAYSGHDAGTKGYIKLYDQLRTYQLLEVHSAPWKKDDSAIGKQMYQSQANVPVSFSRQDEQRNISIIFT